MTTDMTTEIHPCEPSLEQLRKIQKQVAKGESTDENVKKLKAVMKQIERHEKAAAEKKAQEKAALEAKEAAAKAAIDAEKKAKEDEERRKAADAERRKRWHSRPRGGTFEPQVKT